MYIDMYICIYVYIKVWYVYIHIYMYVCVCVYQCVELYDRVTWHTFLIEIS